MTKPNIFFLFIYYDIGYNTNLHNNKIDFLDT